MVIRRGAVRTLKARALGKSSLTLRDDVFKQSRTPVFGRAGKRGEQDGRAKGTIVLRKTSGLPAEIGTCSGAVHGRICERCSGEFFPCLPAQAQADGTAAAGIVTLR
jgi:hypothetical protein